MKPRLTGIPEGHDADLLRFSSESTESQNQAGLLAHPNLPPSHLELVSRQWLFVTNRLWIAPRGLQLRGQLRHLPNSLLIPSAQIRVWEPISDANIA